MSDNVETPQATTETNAPAAAQETGTAATSKTKKVNRLSKDALSMKLKELEEKKQKNSRYYKHLQTRLKELGN